MILLLVSESFCLEVLSVLIVEPRPWRSILCLCCTCMFFQPGRLLGRFGRRNASTSDGSSTDAVL